MAHHVNVFNLTDEELSELLEDIKLEQEERKLEKAEELINNFKEAFQKLKDNDVQVFICEVGWDYYIEDVSSFAFN